MIFTPTPRFLACAAKALSEAVGKQWEVNGRGPSSFDCWGLIWWVYHKGGVELPDWLYSAESSKNSRESLFNLGISEAVAQGFQRVDKPSPLAICPLGHGLNTTHIALYYQGMYYHCAERHGVVGQSIEAIHTVFTNLSYWYPNAG